MDTYQINEFIKKQRRVIELKDIPARDGNTRFVLIEKSECYYYGEDNGLCTETCLVHPDDVRIGSGTCIQCKFNKGFNEEEDYIICVKIKEATKK